MKYEFETDRDDETELPPIPVPLPMEIPAPPNFSQLPAHILHSGTVETLIGQNEDLFARLKVNIRRNSILEQQIMENERVNSELTRVNNSLIAQLQVLQEKDRIWRVKSSSVDSRHQSLREEIEILTARLEGAEERADELQAGLNHESAYKRRVRRWIRPMVDELKSALAKARLRLSETTREIAARDAQISDLKARMAEAVQQIQSQERSHTRDQTKLVEKYETRIQELEAELTKTRSEAKLMRDKALRLDEAVASRTELENRIIYLERQAKDMEQNFTAELRAGQEKVAKYRQEAKTLAVETLEYDKKLKVSADEITALREEHLKLQDQFESLQTLWADAQKRLETSKLQQQSLNRLNQELSRQLKEQRKALESTLR